MSQSMREMLVNWGRFCRQDHGGPDSSCRNSLYDMMVRRDDDGYGDVTELTVVVPQQYEARPEVPEIDEGEAEWLDSYITVLPQTHKAVLCVRYVLMLPCKTPEARDRLTAAITVLEQRLYGEMAAYG